MDGQAWMWSGPLIGADRDAAGLAGALLGATSVLVAGTRGSGRSHLLRAVVSELALHGVAPAVVRPSTVLSGVPYGALDAVGDPRITDLRRGRPAEEGFVVVVDDVHALDIDSALLLARSVADGRVALLASLLIPRARARRVDLDATSAGQTILSLWLDGLAERIDLSELTSADGEELLAVLPGASTLDATICGAILWRADGSRTLLRELVAEAVGAVSADRDPFAAIRDTPPHSRLSVALKLHTADLAEGDQECLAFLDRLPHVEFSVATRFVSASRLEAMITAGLVHSDESPARRLTANEALAREAARQLGPSRIDALVEAAGDRMLDDGGEWWSSPLAVSIAERWHRGTGETDVEAMRPPSLRARVALDAARAANDRGDAAHAAAHAARGLRSQESAELRLEAAFALSVLGTGSESAALDAADPADLDDEGRGRLAHLRVVLEDRGLTVPLYAGTHGDPDTEIERHLDDSARAGQAFAWTGAVESAERALASSSEKTSTHLRARLSAGLAETYRGRWSRARAHLDEVERLLDARQRPVDIGATQRTSAILVMLACHQLAGANGSRIHARLAAERARAAREHDRAALTIAGVAASVADANLGDAEHALLEWEAVREKSAGVLSGPDADLAELSVADALAASGRPAPARAVLARTETGDALLVRHARASVETTVLMAEGRAEEARATARTAAALSRGREVPPLRARDLYRLLVLGILTEEERLELGALLDGSDLPLVVELARRLEAWETGDVHDISTDLRLAAVWSSDDGTHGARPGRISALRSVTSAASASPLRELTRREREIALLVEQGHTNREIAALLYLSVRTVESHVYQARAKVGAESRTALGRLVAQWENQRSRA